ncbi:MAG: CvpA family protein [Cyclobacteriaceae bacterium]|nr:CvpA family protein [Cyclobacteriaceae bacterium]
MDIIDIFISAGIAIGLFSGYRKGLIMGLISLIAFFLGILLAFQFLHWGVTVIVSFTNSYHALFPFLSFILIFVGVVIGMTFLGKLLKGVIHLTPLGIFDKIIGAILGIAKWALALSVLLWLFEAMELGFLPTDDEKSELYVQIKNFAPTLADMTANILPFTDNLFEEIKQLILDGQ